jgi:hypothetical protein
LAGVKLTAYDGVLLMVAWRRSADALGGAARRFNCLLHHTFLMSFKSFHYPIQLFTIYLLNCFRNCFLILKKCIPFSVASQCSLVPTGTRLVAGKMRKN